MSKGLQLLMHASYWGRSTRWIRGTRNNTGILSMPLFQLSWMKICQNIVGEAANLLPFTVQINLCWSCSIYFPNHSWVKSVLRSCLNFFSAYYRYEASEAALSALFSLCSEPMKLGLEMLHWMERQLSCQGTNCKWEGEGACFRAFNFQLRNMLLCSSTFLWVDDGDELEGQEMGKLSSQPLARFFFLGGCVGLMTVVSLFSTTGSATAESTAEFEIKDYRSLILSITGKAICAFNSVSLNEQLQRHRG